MGGIGPCSPFGLYVWANLDGGGREPSFSVALIGIMSLFTSLFFYSVFFHVSRSGFGRISNNEEI